MKISYNWLKQFLNLDWEAEKTAELLTNLGLEVEGIDPFTSIPGGLKGVIVGHVLECFQHPNADRLKITKVDLGNGEPVQIVCGASNVAAGQKVAVATIGTVFFDADKKPFTINKGNIRGEKSEGMICAEDELGLGQSHEGIMVLDKKTKPGTAVSEIFKVENDLVFEIGLTPNRADAMSHLGVARDLRAGLLQNNVSLEFITPSQSNFHINNRSLKFDVKVENPALAPRYCGISITKLKVGPSPAWLQNRLKSIGISPLNNIVDITNYVLHDLGQPLHAFDADAVSGGKIIVKTMPTGTKFKTLDGVERELHEEDLMICDAEKPICLAGVFGGMESGITQTTNSIFLESAYFNPVSIRKTAKRHGLNTDASFRFERGIDPNITKYALKYAAILMVEIAGGEISSDVVDIYPKKIDDHQVFLNFEKATKLIGEEIPKETIKKILTSLEIKINNVTETGIGMTIPAYRNDVTREVDVIEEILRIYGYNNIKFNEKLNASISTTQRVEDHQIQNKAGAILTALGFHEMMGNSLTTPKYNSITPSLSSENNVEILNPLSQELSVMRQSMLYSALEALMYNHNRKAQNIKLFEFGKTYHNFSGLRKESKHLSLVIAGSKNEKNWALPETKTGFFYGKGIIISLLERLGIQGFVENEIKTDLFSEGISLSTKKNELVSFGLLQKKITKHFGIESEVLFADFNWDAVLNEIPTHNFKLKPIPKFPKATRDFALLLDDSVTFEALQKAALQTERHLLKEVTLFDVYTGEKLPKGKKSYALSFTIQDEHKTMTDSQIDKLMGKLQQRFEKDFGAVLR